MRQPFLSFATLVAALLLQGCTVVRVATSAATAPIRYTSHQISKARAEKRGERRAKKGAEKEAEREAPPTHIDRPDALPPETPAN